MNLVGFSLGSWIAGLILLPVLLFLLQLLRVRRRVVRTPTAMLWAQAARAMPSRALGGRFRHWLAYLLVVAIALMLWTGAALPTMRGVQDRDFHLFYLDNSAALGGKGAFAAAQAALMRDVARIAPDRRMVRAGAMPGATLLAPGENIALLSRRLGGLTAQPTPSLFTTWLNDASTDARGGVIHYYGGRHAGRSATTTATGARQVALGYLAPAVADNRGIVNLGISPSRSGAWDKADLLVEAIGSNGAPVPMDQIRVTRAGRPLSPTTMIDAGPGRFLLPDLDADGATIAIALRRSDNFPMDDSAAIRLPVRQPVRVGLTASIPAVISAAIKADPALQQVPLAQAQIVIARRGEVDADKRPALILTDAAAQADSFVFSYPTAEGQDDLAEQIDRTGLSRINVGTLAERLHRPVSVGTVPASRKTVSMWAEIMAEPGFARSSAMPLFLSRSLRWLAAPDPWISYAKAGATLDPRSSIDDLAPDDALKAGSVNGQIILPAAGQTNVAGHPIALSLLDRETTRAAADSMLADTEEARSSLPPDWLFFALALIAGLLIAAEWYAYRKGMMP